MRQPAGKHQSIGIIIPKTSLENQKIETSQETFPWKKWIFTQHPHLFWSSRGPLSPPFCPLGCPFQLPHTKASDRCDRFSVWYYVIIYVCIVCIHICMCMYMYTYIYIYISTHICVYIYIHTYVYIYIYVYNQILTHWFSLPKKVETAFELGFARTFGGIKWRPKGRANPTKKVWGLGR